MDSQANKIQQMYQNQQAIKIQQWWKKRTSMTSLKRCFKEVNKLTPEDFQTYVNQCRAITKKCKGDGAGLTGGTMIDMLTNETFKTKLNAEDCYKGESDTKLCNVPTSIKKINGMSTLALDWSKNEDVSTRENFSCHIMIINLKTEKWWINNPKNKIDQLTSINKGCKITYNDTIPAGIYFVDKKFCKTYIRLSKNNKTNKLITTIFVYLMLKRSISLKMFITLPASNKVLKFNILNAFS
jgi:hypothetical protein